MEGLVVCPLEQRCGGLSKQWNAKNIRGLYEYQEGHKRVVQTTWVLFLREARKSKTQFLFQLT
jgi:hypothetical protein